MFIQAGRAVPALPYGSHRLFRPESGLLPVPQPSSPYLTSPSHPRTAQLSRAPCAQTLEFGPCGRTPGRFSGFWLLSGAPQQGNSPPAGKLTATPPYVRTRVDRGQGLRRRIAAFAQTRNPVFVSLLEVGSHLSAPPTSRSGWGDGFGARRRSPRWGHAGQCRPSGGAIRYSYSSLLLTPNIRLEVKSPVFIHRPSPLRLGPVTTRDVENLSTDSVSQTCPKARIKPRNAKGLHTQALDSQT